jgi:hypothetical protein
MSHAGLINFTLPEHKIPQQTVSYPVTHGFLFVNFFLLDLQGNEVLRGPPELVQQEFTTAQERCMSQITYGLAAPLAYPSGEEGGNFLVQIISICLCYT